MSKLFKNIVVVSAVEIWFPNKVLIRLSSSYIVLAARHP